VKAMNVPSERLHLLSLGVLVKAPQVYHSISGASLNAWLAQPGKNPKEQALKSRLKELLRGINCGTSLSSVRAYASRPAKQRNNADPPSNSRLRLYEFKEVSIHPVCMCGGHPMRQSGIRCFGNKHT
jgi:hypothetical protein